MCQGSGIFYVCLHVASVCVSGRSVFWSVRGALCASESPCCIVTEKHDLCSAVPCSLRSRVGKVQQLRGNIMLCCRRRCVSGFVRRAPFCVCLLHLPLNFRCFFEVVNGQTFVDVISVVID